MKVCAIIQARMTSTRLPGKVLLDLSGKTVLERVIERVAQINGLDEIVVAIPQGDAHTSIAELVNNVICNIPVSIFYGDDCDVLDRTYQAAKALNAQIVLRITSDCPFVDPTISGSLLDLVLMHDLSYARLDSKAGYPIGFDTEVIRFSALEKAAAEATEIFDREHVTPYIWRRPDEFPSIVLGSTPNHRSWRLVIDNPSDYEFAKKLYKELEKSGSSFSYKDICAVLSANHQLLDINKDVRQKAEIGRVDT